MKAAKLTQKKYKTRHDWVGKFNLLRIVQETEILPYEQMNEI